MRIRLLGADTELGGAVLQEAAERGHEIVDTACEVLVNVLRQPENSLLHDGWAWKGAKTRFAEQTAEVLEAARRDSPRLIVDAGHAFLYGNARNATEQAAQHPAAGNERFVAAIEAEKAIRTAGLPVSTLRLGFGYGPRYQDLKRYRNSFRVLRPYYAGPGLAAPWLHHDDAAAALVTAAESAPAGSVFNVADDEAVSLRDFIDHFGRRELHAFTYHLPRWSLRFLGGQIRKEQVALLDQETTLAAGAFRSTLGWKPVYPTYREGLAQTVRAWRS